MTREQIKQELLQDPEYARIAGLEYAPAAIEYYISSFAAYKIAFGQDSTVQQWQQYHADYDKREQYRQLMEIINTPKLCDHTWHVSAADIPGYYYCTVCRIDGYYDHSSRKILAAA